MITARWPTQIDYQDALKDPGACFTDPELRIATAAEYLPFGLPRPVSGQFANVYRVRLPQGAEAAVRLFLTPSLDRAARYAAIGDHFASLGDRLTGALVPFVFQPQGIHIGDADYPLLRMDWIAGTPLHDFIEAHLYESARIRALAESWRALMRELTAVSISHGDLQHGNVLIEDGSSAAAGTGTDTIRLIDYDSTWVPALTGRGSPEIGHPAYQHPKRNARDFGPETDRFSALLIYVALRVIAAAPPVWFRRHNGDNLILQPDDFVSPGDSHGFRYLREALLHNHAEMRLLDDLKNAAIQSPGQVADIDAIVGGGR